MDRDSGIDSYLAVLANATVTGTDVAAVLLREEKSVRRPAHGRVVARRTKAPREN